MDWLLGAALGRAAVTVAGREVVQGDLLADGGFAYVYRGHDKCSGEEIAIRRVLLQDSEAVKAARIEIGLLQRLPPHPHIVRFIGAEILQGGAGTYTEGGSSSSSSQAVSLFELCTGGTLLSRLEVAVERGLASRTSAAGGTAPLVLAALCPCLPEQEALAVLDGMAAALAVLHQIGVVHYDVKSENILLGADDVWKLGDFGSASERTFTLFGAPRRLLLEAEEFVHGRCTPIYRSPEVADVHLRWPIGPKADIFALGCVLFATMTGVHPFPMDSALANIQARFQLPPEADAAYSDALGRWVRRLLAREPGDRPSAAELSAEVEGFKSSGTEPPTGRRAEVQVEASSAAEFAEPDWVADFSALPPPPGPAAVPDASSSEPWLGPNVSSNKRVDSVTVESPVDSLLDTEPITAAPVSERGSDRDPGLSPSPETLAAALPALESGAQEVKNGLQEQPEPLQSSEKGRLKNEEAELLPLALPLEGPAGQESDGDRPPSQHQVENLEQDSMNFRQDSQRPEKQSLDQFASSEVLAEELPLPVSLGLPVQASAPPKIQMPLPVVAPTAGSVVGVASQQSDGQALVLVPATPGSKVPDVRPSGSRRLLPCFCSKVQVRE